MKHLSVLIIDDEQRNVELLSKLLQTFPNVEVCGTANNALTGAKMIRKMEPDLVLLDIQMPDGDGFDLLEVFPDRTFKVVFVTAHDQYAIRAIKQKAYDYLLKPIDPDEMEAVISELTGQNDPSAKPKTDKLVINTTTDTYFVDIASLIRVESEGNYCTFYLKGGQTIVAAKNLKKVWEDLPEDHFFRSHKSHIVNIHYISKLNKLSSDHIELMDGSKIPLSRRRKDEFLHRLT